MKTGQEKVSFTVLQETTHNMALKMRNIDMFVQSNQRFKRVWEAASTEQREKAYKYIREFRFEELKSWCYNQRTGELRHESWKNLIVLARIIGIAGYSRMSKDELVTRIYEYEQRQKEFWHSGGKTSQSGKDSEHPREPSERDHEASSNE